MHGRARIELEEWVDGELRELYGLGDDDLSGDQEIDLDLVWDEDEGDREMMVKASCDVPLPAH